MGFERREKWSYIDPWPSNEGEWVRYKVDVINSFAGRFGFINGVDNVNWPPYRDSKS